VNRDQILDARLRLAADGGCDRRHASNLANALWLGDQLAEAHSWARWATRGDPVHPLAWRCLGNVLLDLGRYGEADQAYRLADPSGMDAATQFNRSKVALGRGDLALAWDLAEFRLRRPQLPDGARPGPWWQGWPDAETLTIWSEQGLGDTLQFLRWLPLLLARGPRVTLLVQPPLQRLVAHGLSWLGPNLCVLSQDERPVGGCHGSLLSLPWRLGVPLPAWPMERGYLRLLQPGLNERLAAGVRPLRIGLVWGGGVQTDGHARERDYRRKSVLGEPLRVLVAGLQELPVALVRLQFGPDRAPPELQGVAWASDPDPQGDLLDLAEQVQRLDLLITVDTAAAHLAGAMGLPAWLLLPWAAASRWGRDSFTTPWYPSLRLWRQPRHGDWLGLWPAVLRELRMVATAAAVQTAADNASGLPPG
jgi:hypothetical protein